MKENVGRTDQTLRSIVGPLMLVMGYHWLNGNRGKPAGLAAMIFGALIIESAITRTCPLNAFLGIDTTERLPAPTDI